jgi:SSS family solute:Na+ symporter
VIPPAAFVIGTVVVYLLVVLGIGEYARRRTTQDREDYFMASRGFGTLVLLFALLATNMTAFVMIGAPGTAYQAGIGMYGYVNGVFTLVFPLVFATVGYRLWLAGKRFGHITPGQVFNHRFESNHLGTFVMLLMTFWTIPYLLLGGIGGGLVFQGLTQGAIPYWLGSLIPIVIVFVYVLTGGMRGTGWTNVFQGAVFIVFLWGVLFLVGSQLGGFGAATQAVAEVNPDLLTRDGAPPFSTRGWFSFSLVLALSAVMFPHLFRRMLVALDEQTMKKTMVLYPIGLILTWVPAILIGFWGAGQITGLTGSEVDTIVPAMVGNFTPPIVIGLALAGILAAIMSSLDGQTLTVSTMISEDLIREYGEDVSESREVYLARAVVGLVLLVTFGLALVRPGTIVSIAEFGFSGYALVFFPTIASLYWRGMSEEAAWAGLIWGFLGLWAFELGLLPGSLTFGFMPFVPVFATQVLVTLLVGYVTDAPSRERVYEYFSLYDGVW